MIAYHIFILTPPEKAYGMLEVSVEALDRARQCFRTGLLSCPGRGNVQLLQAWGCLEMRDGDAAKARDLIQQVSFVRGVRNGFLL